MNDKVKTKLHTLADSLRSSANIADDVAKELPNPTSTGWRYKREAERWWESTFTLREDPQPLFVVEDGEWVIYALWRFEYNNNSEKASVYLNRYTGGNVSQRVWRNTYE